MSATVEILECGHPEPEHSDTTRGYDEQGNRYCYDCCLAREQKRLEAGEPVTAYLSQDGSAITMWPGQKLMTVTSERESSAGGFAWRTMITRVTARDKYGRNWYGRGPGRGMYINLRRFK